MSVQMELGTYPEPIQAVLGKLLEGASPSAQVPLHWRYSLMSLAIFLFLMPPADAASAKVSASSVSMQLGLLYCNVFFSN